MNYYDFKLIKILGQGSFGVVILAIYNGTNFNNLESGQVCVLKVLLDSNNTEFQPLEKIKQHKNQNVVKYYGVFEFNGKKILVLEYILGKDLFTYVDEKQQTGINPIVVKKILKQIVNGLAFLKTNGIIHRDIKLENVMYEEKSGMVKIVDFGLAKLNNNSKLNFDFMGELGTKQYKPPELNSDGISSSEGDIWSLGVLLYTLVFNDFLVPNIRGYRNNLPKLKSVIDRKIQGLKCDDEIKGLIQDMLKVERTERITIEDLELKLQGVENLDAELYESKVKHFQESVFHSKQNQESLSCLYHLQGFMTKKDYEKFIDDRLRTEGIPDISNKKFFLCKQDNCQIKIETIGWSAFGPKICHRCGISVCDTHSQTISRKLFKKHISTGNRRIKDHEKNTETGKIKTGVLGYVSYTGSSMTKRVSDKIRVCNLCAEYAQKEPTLVFDNLLGGKKKKTVKKKTYKKIIAGRKRVIHTGPKGGKYFIRSKKKVYIK